MFFCNDLVNIKILIKILFYMENVIKNLISELSPFYIYSIPFNYIYRKYTNINTN